MTRLSISVIVVALVVLSPVGVEASDLGSAGPFRSIGGADCVAGSTDRCAPPIVDPGLSPAQQVRRHVERALAFLDLVRVKDARAALDDALKLDPDDLQALTLRGRLGLTDGQSDTARSDIEHALRLAPNDPYLLATIAIFSFPDQAQIELDAALAQKPDDLDILFAKARHDVNIGDLNTAVADLSHSLAIAPEDQRARIFRAKLQLRRHAYDAAVVDASKILALHPNDLPALLIKATARLGAGDDVGAIETFTELLDTSNGKDQIFIPEYHEALVNRGRLYAKLRRFTEAKRDFDVLIGQQSLQALLQMQLYLRSHGFPNVEISNQRTQAFETALSGCFSDTMCGPNLFR